jgi:hypothetical protein
MYLLCASVSLPLSVAQYATPNDIIIFFSLINAIRVHLVEGLYLNRIHTKLLSLEEFPTGIQYHHNRTYMQRLHDKLEHPYNFHMCWTLNKKDKLANFKNASMWYMSDSCTLNDFHVKRGSMLKYVKQLQYHGKSNDNVWDLVSNKCCAIMNDAP